MGTGINIDCGNCKYNESFMLGTGEFYVVIDNCLEALPEKDAEDIKKRLEKDPIKDFTFEYKLFQCDNCSLLFDHGDLHIDFNHGESHDNPIACKSCHTDMRKQEQAKKQIEELTCPTCSKVGELHLTAQMDWD